MTETRDKLNAIVDALPLTDAVKKEIKELLDDLEEAAFDRGVRSLSLD